MVLFKAKHTFPPTSSVSYIRATTLKRDKRYLKVSDVGEEEADEGEGQKPFGHGADHVSRVTLRDKTTLPFHTTCVFYIAFRCRWAGLDDIS